MKVKLIKFSKKPFVRNVIVLTTGTAAAQVVSFVFAPLITRLYGPEVYGVMGTFMAIISIIIPVAALAYPIAIVLPKQDSDAKGLIKLSLLISIIIAIVVGIILALFHQPITQVFQLEDISQYLFLIPIVIILAGFLQVVEQWLIRTKQFAISARAAFLQSIIVNGGKAGIGFYHPVASVLIVFSAVSQGLKASLLLLFSRKSNSKKVDNTPKEKPSIKELAKRYKDFPIYRAPQIFLDAISQGLPVLMLTSFFGAASAGFYSIGRTVLTIPSQLIGKSVGDVFYPRISEAANNGENLTELIKKATIALGIVGVIPYGLVVLFGPWLFSLVFGSEWATAGEYARWISLWMFFMFVNRPSIQALPVISAQSFHLKFTIVSLITRIFLLGLGYYIFSSDLVAIALFGISGALLNIVLILLTLKRSKKFTNN